MAGAFHGLGQPEVCINVGVSGPGVVTRVVRALPTQISASWPTPSSASPSK